MSISAIVTTLNDGPLLREALESVAGQTRRPDEVIVIDDGSEPASAPSIIGEIGEAFDIVIHYRWQPNQGPSAARNAGLALATGHFVAFLDADDRWLADHLERKLVHFSCLGPEYSTVYGGFVEFDGPTGRRLTSIDVAEFDGPIPGELLGRPGGIPAGVPFQLHRTEALRAIGGLDPALRVNEDFDLLLRLGQAGFKIAGRPKPTVERRVHPGSHTRQDPVATFNEVERFLDKAEARGLLSPGDIAVRRKWARLQLARQMLNSPTRDYGEALAQLRAAFRFGAPNGWKQAGAYVLGQSRGLGVAAVRLYRYLRSGSEVV